MALADITRAAVEQAIREFDQLGRDAFLETHGFGRSRQYVLVHEGRDYDSKAILGVAHGFVPGREPLSAGEFSGGVNGHTVDHLRRLGFEVRTVS
jgi:5-methylcytosine-specific restriction protein A